MGREAYIYDRLVDLDIVFLGTSGSAPTARRATSALLVRRGGDRLLFDCGEGTQRQLLQSSVGLVDLRDVFLTHFHLDHWLGLPGMLKTFALRDRQVPLTVYGPPGLKALFQELRRVIGRLTYPFELVEVRAGDALERDGYRVLVVPVAHGTAAVGYALAEEPRPGRFDVDAADAMEIPFGPERGALQRGESITLIGVCDGDRGDACKSRQRLDVERADPADTDHAEVEGTRHGSAYSKRLHSRLSSGRRYRRRLSRGTPGCGCSR